MFQNSLLRYCRATIIGFGIFLFQMEAAAVAPPPPDGPPAPILTGIILSGPDVVDEETTAQYVCTGRYSDGTTAPISASWSEDSTYASIASSGLLSALNVAADQNVIITATYGGYSASLSIVIKYLAPVFTGITISGPSVVNEETTAQYTCTANYSDGTSASVGATWAENSSYASISGAGLLSAGNVTSDQNLSITASFDGQTDTHAVTIKYVAPLLTGITISGATSVNEGTTAQYTCTANYSDGTSNTVTPSWSSENASFATISAGGLLSAGSNVTSNQNVTITANYGGNTDTHTVTIKYVAPTLTGIAISGATSLDEETYTQFTCIANWSDGTSTTVTPTWSENSPYAAISVDGVLSAGNVTTDRSLTVTASYEGKSDTHGVTILYVEPPIVLTGISIAGPAELNENSTTNFSCTANYSDGTSAPVNPTWAQNAGFATITSSGVISVGNIDSDSTLTVTASYQGFTDTQVMSIWTIGTRIVYPLQGFSGNMVRARLWDAVAGELIPLGEMNSPDELVITDLNSDQWYWIVVEEYDALADDWIRVHANWFSM